MNNKNPYTLSERLSGLQIAQSCSDSFIKMTIGDYYKGHENILRCILSLPSSEEWGLKSSDPLHKLITAYDYSLSTDVSRDYTESNIRKAIDLIIYPIVASDYNHPLFRFTISGFVKFMDDKLDGFSHIFIQNDDIHMFHNSIMKKWSPILDKSINNAIKIFNENDDKTQKYQCLDVLISNIFGDMYLYYEKKRQEISYTEICWRT